MQIKIVLLLFLFSSGCLISFSCPIPWLETSVQGCMKMVRPDILSFSQSYGENIQTFTIKYDVYSGFFHSCTLLCWGNFLIFLLYWVSSSWKFVGFLFVCLFFKFVGFYQMPSLGQLRWSCAIFAFFYWYGVLH